MREREKKGSRPRTGGNRKVCDVPDPDLPEWRSPTTSNATLPLFSRAEDPCLFRFFSVALGGNFLRGSHPECGATGELLRRRGSPRGPHFFQRRILRISGDARGLAAALSF